jgi:hypothetical protein
MNTGVNYRKVPQDDKPVQDTAYDQREQKKKARAERMERISNKIHAFLWCCAAGATVYYTDFFRTIMESPEVSRCVPLLSSRGVCGC